MPVPDHHSNAELDPEGFRRAMLEEDLAFAESERLRFLEATKGELTPEQIARRDELTGEALLAQARLMDAFPPEVAEITDAPTDVETQATIEEISVDTEPPVAEAPLTLAALRAWRQRHPSIARRRDKPGPKSD